MVPFKSGAESGRFPHANFRSIDLLTFLILHGNYASCPTTDWLLLATLAKINFLYNDNLRSFCMQKSGILYCNLPPGTHPEPTQNISRTLLEA